ncbi:MAG: hypothetical protein ACRDZN_15445, partial [Acidimicrobiales bacterium]
MSTDDDADPDDRPRSETELDPSAGEATSEVRPRDAAEAVALGGAATSLERSRGIDQQEPGRAEPQRGAAATARRASDREADEARARTEAKAERSGAEESEAEDEVTPEDQAALEATRRRRTRLVVVGVLVALALYYAVNLKFGGVGSSEVDVTTDVDAAGADGATVSVEVMEIVSGERRLDLLLRPIPHEGVANSTGAEFA